MLFAKGDDIPKRHRRKFLEKSSLVYLPLRAMVLDLEQFGLDLFSGKYWLGRRSKNKLKKRFFFMCVGCTGIKCYRNSWWKQIALASVWAPTKLLDSITRTDNCNPHLLKTCYRTVFKIYNFMFSTEKVFWFSENLTFGKILFPHLNIATK